MSNDVRPVQQIRGLADQWKKMEKSATPVNSICIWSGQIATGAHAGHAAGVLSLGGSAAWVSGQARAVLVAISGEDLLPNTMKTQGHSAGTFISGSYNYQLYFETPANWTGSHAKAVRDLIHIVLGQNGSPVEVFFGTNGVNPQVSGVNGADDAAETAAGFVSAGFTYPYSQVAYSGGI